MYRGSYIRTADGTVRPTLAGLLALGTYPQQFFPQLSITFTHYRGTTKASDASGIRYTDTLTVEGPIPLLIEEATRKVQAASPRGAIMRGAFRYDLFDFPPVAVREAITNAVMHRDYSPEARGTQVQVDLFADRLEVRNPGGLYGAVTVDTLGTDGISSSRNLALSRILESTPYLDDGFVAENRGSGYQEILDKLHRDLLPPPEVRNSLTRFALLFYKRGETEHTTLTKHTESSAHAHSIAHSKPAVNTSTREAIVDYLRTHDSASTKELADAAGVTAETIRRSLRQLLTENLVSATAPQRSPKQRYRLAQLAPARRSAD
ncbi:ATP-binding protein [Corynebacterium propinquum]|uniref:ATP-binding protein n=1 Tax=Corynebacterium propinquum TaxID=43769 RepID=UPI0025429652|nr:ATP-binding protein [Corynebacterium propinquum]MDK4283100.1 ATP-binding protein [Corynebacterium propinquum]